MPGVRRLFKTLRELGFPAADLRSGPAAGFEGARDAAGASVATAIAGLTHQIAGANGRAAQPDLEHEAINLVGPALPFAAAALLREYEAWLGEWDEACKRVAMGGTYALDTIYAFARLRTTYPFAPDILDDATLDILCALPWDAHHRALLGFDPALEPSRIRDEAERRIGQACAILGDAALAVPVEGDYHNRLLWLQRIATAHGKAAQEALLAALLAAPGQPLLSVANTQSRHGAAAVLGRLCERARLPATGPMGGALAALDERHQDVVEARPVLVHRHSGEPPQADWLLPLAIVWPEDPPDAPPDDATLDEPPVDPPLGAPYGRRLRALADTVQRVEGWYTSAAAALRVVTSERVGHAPVRSAALAALADRRLPYTSSAAGGDGISDTGDTSPRSREEFSPQRATTTLEQVRARAQMTREQLRDAAAQIERADSTTWMQVVNTARQLERWLAPVARGWVETDPSVTPLIRQIREQAAHIATLTTPPMIVRPVEAVLEVSAPEPDVEPVADLTLIADHSVADSVDSVAEGVALVEGTATLSEALPDSIAVDSEAYELPDIPAHIEPPKPKRRRTRKKVAPVVAAEVGSEAPAPPKRTRKRKAKPEPEQEQELASDLAPETIEAHVAEVIDEVTAEPAAEPAQQPEPPPPPIDWTPQLKVIEALGAHWARRDHKRPRSASDPEREQLIGQLNQLVWPIVSGGIDPTSDAGRTIRRTLEPIVNEANRFADRQHNLAMHSFRNGATQANSFGARKAMREAMQEIEAGLDYSVPECPGPFRDVREEYDATRNRLMLLRNYIAVKL